MWYLSVREFAKNFACSFENIALKPAEIQLLTAKKKVKNFQSTNSYYSSFLNERLFSSLFAENYKN